MTDAKYKKPVTKNTMPAYRDSNSSNKQKPEEEKQQQMGSNQQKNITNLNKTNSNKSTCLNRACNKNKKHCQIQKKLMNSSA